MNPNERISVFLLCFFLLFLPVKSHALLGGTETTTSANILTQSANISCLAWRPVGICVWLQCTPLGCSLQRSVKVKHYIPDSVVSTYPVTGKSPWLETRSMSSPNSLAQSGGSNKEGSTTRSETALLFKHADVIGSPGTLWVSASSGYTCKPTTTPYFPYFISTLDHAWRDPVVETPLTLTNMSRQVSSGFSIWSSVYPRIGFVNQGHDYKAGAVAAQRVGDIVTRKLQPHLYIPMVAQGRQGQWPPGALKEGDEETGKWQQLIPSSQASTCRVFADQSDVTSILSDPFSLRINEVSGYSFNLWRPYRCCKQKGQTLVSHTGN